MDSYNCPDCRLVVGLAYWQCMKCYGVYCGNCSVGLGDDDLCLYCRIETEAIEIDRLWESLALKWGGEDE